MEQVQAPPADVLAALTQAAERYNVPLNVLVGVAWVESRYRANAVSQKGAIGLMQLMPQTARSLGVTNPFDLTENAAGGAKLLKQLFDRYQEWQKALAAYVWGPGNVNQRPDTAQWPKSVVEYTEHVREAARTAPLPFPLDVTIITPHGLQHSRLVVSG